MTYTQQSLLDDPEFVSEIATPQEQNAQELKSRIEETE